MRKAAPATGEVPRPPAVVGPIGPMRTSGNRRSDTRSPCYGLYSSGAADLSDLVPAAFTRVNIFFLDVEVGCRSRPRSALVGVEDVLLLHDGRRAGAPEVRSARRKQVRGSVLSADLENGEVRQGATGATGRGAAVTSAGSGATPILSRYRREARVAPPRQAAGGRRQALRIQNGRFAAIGPTLDRRARLIIQWR